MSHTPTKTSCEAILRELVHAGTLAPSGDNTQPWNFEIDPAESRVTVSVDPTRDPSPMNAGQRMARIAVGAAVENIVLTATANDLSPTVSDIQSDAVVIRIEGETSHTIRIPNEIRERCTNRKFYDGSSIPETVLERLAQIPVYGGVQIRWVLDREEIKRLAQIIRRADTLLFTNHAMRNAFLENIRFDRPANEAVREGLSLGSLEATPSEAKALKMLTKLPNWMASVLRVGPGIGRKSQKLVESSSGLCIGFAPDRATTRDFQVGRSMENAWLELTKQGFAVQPMMSIPVLDNVAEGTFGSSRVRRRKTIELCSSLSPFSDSRPAFFLRFGSSPSPSVRTGRLSSINQSSL